MEHARQAEQHRQAALDDIQAEMATITAQWSRAHDKAERYSTQLLPGARAVLESSRADFSVGQADFASLFEAEIALLSLERAWLSAVTQTWLLHAAALGVLGTSPLEAAP